MSEYSRVEPFIQQYFTRWMESPTAKRISDVEFAAIASGRAGEWDGISITDFWVDILREYTDTLRANPELLTDVEQENLIYRHQLQDFLDEENKLIARADELKSAMTSYKLGALDPRWHKAKNELHSVVSKFRLTGVEGSIDWDKMPHG